MASGVNVLNIEVSGEPARFTDPLTFRVTFECENGLPAGASLGRVWVDGSLNFERRPFAFSRIASPPMARSLITWWIFFVCIFAHSFAA